ncbi:MAG: 2-oxoglutarate and iron-dependent oxygenase domain-containing protein [Alphaproteobacteria bacterium]|nr:isopenicillin N synthase family oxygenase [Rhodospirillaceae bacterium]MDG2481388.1 2-oxoglutarate and iron-dependent oxygenase domain-containing protein [Alphaproteobacteria bacterium]MBT6202437.1 isopenicillin N synthase family oxygenase [Rhodospirillaceae bacterium]MBT6512978.1 isopenicillin N synthase family oxygenase [Rhodospirillaceae bacterium]MBT7614619.1 isopenicillin N synthase family oxygenase [Rhodospirillaceae bacterium]
MIDISPLANGDLDARRDVARQIGETCETVGFLYVAGHGIDQAVIDHAGDATERFFALPAAQKTAIARREGTMRGYIPPMPFAANTHGAPPTTYEGFNLGADAPLDDPEVAATGGLYGANVWPDEPADFRTAIEAYWRAVDRVSQRLLGACALALGQDENCLMKMFAKQLSNITLLHYHARPDLIDAPVDDTTAHRDTNAITVLLPSPVGGLQVQGLNGLYREVAPEPGCFVVNIGNMMECWSGGRFRSTMHRVHPPRHLERYAIGFFAVPDFNTVVEPLPGLAVTGTPEDMASRHAGDDLTGFVRHFDQQVRDVNSPA